MNMAVVRAKKVPSWKIEEVKLLKDLLLKHNTVCIASIEGIGSSQLYEIRRKLRGKAVLRVSKNTLMRIAIKQIANEKRGIEGLIDHLHHQNIFIFTNMNPFELKIFLDKNKVPRPARPGDVATEDIVVPAGNTGLPPGPIMSTFSKFKIPVRIEEGSIVVMRDTLVVKKGEKIPRELADLLNRLGIEPIKVGLDIKAAYTAGRVLSKEELSLDLEEYKKNIEEAHLSALKLALAIAYPAKETLPLVITKAYTEALNLATHIPIMTGEPLKYAILRAQGEATALASILASKAPELGISVAAPERPKVPAEVPSEKKEEEKEEKKEEAEEEEVAEGLASLFG
ncbi:MAG: 50S ribosomal protein L10 [Thermoprotei archaeon]|nr:MAG: 50S ribosomal protein L10 [Thermoprotei archaeon]RLF24529.1 MAG: 50S ribosomal protein L10 [Thermoprotei archaeon]